MSKGLALFALLMRDMKLALRSPGDLINPLIFFLLVVTLFPLGSAAGEAHWLAGKGGAIIWVAALLASLWATDALFRADFDSGMLEQLALAPEPLWFTLLIRILVHWTLSGLPLALLSPLLGIMYGLDLGHCGVLLVTLLLGTPQLSLVGAVGAGLMLGVRRSGVLLSLLILPFYIPVLILGTGALDAAVRELPWVAPLLWQAMLLMLAVTLAPLGAAAAVRMALDG
ncbi:MAG: heme exporter protein CcmB [Kistimonas sp.]|nr:heme exporter protein CcmB [Kistimonas sp.]